MKVNYALISRVLIALLFVVAGFGKIMGFEGTAGFVGSLGVPLPTLATLLVVIIEVPVALLFAIGYRTRETGIVLAAFTALATLLVHNNLGDQNQMIMALKNIAIIGGIMAAIKCTCDCDTCKTCTVKKK